MANPIATWTIPVKSPTGSYGSGGNTLSCPYVFTSNSDGISLMANGNGGRRAGAGRPAGSGWKPAVSALRLETIEKMREIVAADRDPLSTVVDWVLDESLDIQLRLSAAHVCLPYLYPRLNATQVDSRITVTKVDSAQLLDRLSARIERLASPAAIDLEAESAEAPEAA